MCTCRFTLLHAQRPEEDVGYLTLTLSPPYSSLETGWQPVNRRNGVTATQAVTTALDVGAGGVLNSGPYVYDGAIL